MSYVSFYFWNPGELQFSEYLCSELFVKYHEFNIMGQVSDL